MSGDFNFDKNYEEEKSRFEEDLRLWEECYRRFKPRFDTLSGYEKRIEELEEEIERHKSILKMNIKKEKNSLVTIAVIVLIASLILVKIFASSGNVWASFIVGLVVGILGTVMIKMWTA